MRPVPSCLFYNIGPAGHKGGLLYYVFAISLLAAIGFVTTGLERRPVELNPEIGPRCFPGVGILGALLVVGGVQLFNGIAVIVLQYKSVVETSSYSFFYAGQFLAAVTAYLLLVKWRLKIMDAMYIYLFAILSGFVLSVGGKSAGLNAFELGGNLSWLCKNRPPHLKMAGGSICL